MVALPAGGFPIKSLLMFCSFLQEGDRGWRILSGQNYGHLRSSVKGKMQAASSG